MKYIKVYGVQMTSFQEMQFAKYRDINNISMNTKTKEERFNITINFINSLIKF